MQIWTQRCCPIVPGQFREKHWFECCYGHKDVVQLLLDNSERNIDLNARTNGGYTATALMWACVNGHKDIVQLLLDKSPSNIVLNAKDFSRNSALMIACQRANQDIAQLITAKLNQ